MASETNRISPFTDAAERESFAIGIEAAELYEARFVPAIFAAWAPQLVDVAGIGSGCHVLDVGCGTGIVARTAAERVGPGGSVSGVDLNPAMLAVAGRVRPDLTWRQGDVAALPFGDRSFDAVVSQMALMFVADVVGALAEMARVAVPGGTVAVLVPAALEDQLAYRVFVEVASRHAGPDARTLLGTYWNRGDLDQLTADFTAAGLEEIATVTRSSPARFATVADFVQTEVGGSPLGELLDEASVTAIVADTELSMDQWLTGAGFEIPLVCHLVAARRP